MSDRRQWRGRRNNIVTVSVQQVHKYTLYVLLWCCVAHLQLDSIYHWEDCLCFSHHTFANNCNIAGADCIVWPFLYLSKPTKILNWIVCVPCEVSQTQVQCINHGTPSSAVFYSNSCLWRHSVRKKNFTPICCKLDVFLEINQILYILLECYQN